MSRDHQLRLKDIEDSIEAIQRYMDCLNYESFCKDDKTMDAVTRRLEIIGEAVKHLPEELTGPYQNIPWRAIAGFRDILAHGYFRADHAIIWDAANLGIQELKPVIQKMLR